MLISSTVIFSIGSGERNRCSNIAPVRRLRSFAWMKARRLPGVRCSTLNTECRSLLCLMIMPGRNWVAGIDIAARILLDDCDRSPGRQDEPQARSRHRDQNTYFTQGWGEMGNHRRAAWG